MASTTSADIATTSATATAARQEEVKTTGRLKTKITITVSARADGTVRPSAVAVVSYLLNLVGAKTAAAAFS